MRILAIASAGGHWVQLLRLIPAFENKELVFISTNKSFAETVNGFNFYSAPDSNRWNKLRILLTFFFMSRLIFSIKPNVIISTGAAPGLMGIIVGKIIGAKTIWVDSIANVEQVSLSGRIASVFADRVYTQWPKLAKSNIIYSGTVL